MPIYLQVTQIDLVTAGLVRNSTDIPFLKRAIKGAVSFKHPNPPPPGSYVELNHSETSPFEGDPDMLDTL